MIKFYFKLARDSIKKNKALYWPYIISNAVMIAVFYLFSALQDTVSYYKQLQQFPQLLLTMTLGIVVLSLFLFIFELYINSFVIKKRQSEYGVFNVLGFTKKNIIGLNFCETIIVFVRSLLIGLTTGIFLGRIILKILLNLVQIKVNVDFKISTYGILMTIGCFIILLVILWMINAFKILHKKAIDLVKANNKIEKQPKNNWLVGVLGILILLAGYTIAICVNNFDKAIQMIFIAVVLVIIGTYLLFVSGSALILNLLKKNKKFYFKRTNFISLSNLIYRVKQNAVGLATVCILSTMVVVTLTTTLLTYQVPKRTKELIFLDNPSIVMERFSNNEQADANDINKNFYIGDTQKDIKKALGDQYRYSIVSTGDYLVNNALNLKIINTADYNRFDNSNLKLQNNEVAIYGDLTKKYRVGDNIKLGKETFIVRHKVFDSKFADQLYESATNKKDNFIVVNKPLKSLTVLNTDSNYYMANKSYLKLQKDTIDNENKIISRLQKKLPKNEHYVNVFQGANIICEEQLKLVGSLLFVGFFLSIVFIITSVLIIYYKQVSEGIRDKANIQMMKKIGMEERLVKATIKKQTLLIFFSPLLVCFIHVLMACPIFSQILKVFLVNNKKDVFIAIMIVFICFTLLYSVVYLLSSKSYYKIIEEE